MSTRMSFENIRFRESPTHQKICELNVRHKAIEICFNHLELFSGRSSSSTVNAHPSVLVNSSAVIFGKFLLAFSLVA